MKNYFWLICLTVFVTGCSVSSGQGDARSGETIDTSSTSQEKFKQEWLTAVEGKVFTGRPNVFGGGGSKFFAVFLFDKEGNLHNTDDDNFVTVKKYYSLHRILFFKSGTEAVVRFYRSASSTLYNEIYALKISNNTLYRTDNVINKAARGFATVSSWDGATYSEDYMNLFATNSTRPYPADPLVVPDENS
ncbi:MAG: hypothetical protein ACRC9L_07705 [Brevinema sp.]